MLPELEAKITSSPPTGNAVALFVDPLTHRAVVASAFRALWVWFGLLAFAAMLCAGGGFCLIAARKAADAVRETSG